MTFINNFITSGNPQADLEKYMELKGITDEEQAKKELQEQYEEPTVNKNSIQTNDLGAKTNVNFLALQGVYNQAALSLNSDDTNDAVLINQDSPSRRIPFGQTDEFGNKTYTLDNFGLLQPEERFGINEVPTNCTNIKVDYKDGEANCVIFLDKNGERIGHMYTKDQTDENGNVADDAKGNKIVLYNNADKNSTVLNSVILETRRINIPPNINITWFALSDTLYSQGFSNLKTVLDNIRGGLNYAVDYDKNGKISCIKITDFGGKRIGHMYINGDNEDNNKLIMYGDDTKPTKVYEFDDNKRLSSVYDSNGKKYHFAFDNNKFNEFI